MNTYNYTKKVLIFKMIWRLFKSMFILIWEGEGEEG